MIPRSRLRSYVVFCMLWSYVPVEGIASEPPPAGIHLIVATEDIGLACRRFAASDVGGVLCGPEFRPLIDALVDQGRGGPFNLEPLFGFNWSQLSAVTVPCRILAFTVNDKELGFAIVFLASAEDDGVKALLDEAEAAFVNSGYTINKAPADQEAKVFVKSVAASNATRVIFTSRSYSGIASSAAAAASIAAWSDGDLLAPASPEADSASNDSVTFFLRPWPLFDALSQDRSGGLRNGGEETSSDGAWLEAAHRVGWDGIESVRGAVRIDGEQTWLWQLDMTIDVRRPLSGALRLGSFVTGAVPKLQLPFGPQTTGGCILQCDFAKVMDGFATLFDDANEPGTDGVGLFNDLLLGLLEDPEGPQVDLHGDLFKQLGPTFAWLSSTPSAGEEASQTLYFMEVRDWPKTQNALVKFYRDDDRVRHSQVNGFDLWTVPEGSSLFVEGESDSLIMIRALALGKEQMLFSTDENLVTSQLDKPTAGGDHPPWLEQVRKLAGGDAEQVVLWGFWELGPTLAASYQASISSSATQDIDASGLLWRILLFGSADSTTELPFKAAPSYDALRSVLPSVGLVVAESHGEWKLTLNTFPADAAAVGE